MYFSAFLLFSGLALASGRDCDTQIGSFTADQIKVLGRQFVKPLVEEQFIESASRAFFLTAKYDVKVMKMCSSCRRTDEWIIDTGVGVPPEYQIYCSQQGYAYHQTQSSLVFLPLDPETGEVFNSTYLRAFVNYADADVDIGQTPTVEFPRSLEDLADPVVEEANEGISFSQDFLVKYLPTMLAASSGSVGLLPDYLGYGESSNLNRTAYSTISIEQITAIHYIRLQQYIESLGSCTKLDTFATVRGVDYGAFAGVIGSDTLRRLGVRSLANFAGSGLFDSEILLDDILMKARNGTVNDANKRLLASLTYGFSSELNGLSNTGTNQRLVSGSHFDVIAGFFAPSPLGFTAINQVLPIDPAAVIDPPFRALYDENTDEVLPCTDFLTGNSNGVYNDLCTAIDAASVWPLVDGSERDVVFNHSICFSPDDEVYSPRHYTEAMFTNPMVTSFAGPKGFEELAPSGNHNKARQLCTLAPILFFNLEGHTPEAVEDRPHFMAPLTVEDREKCGLQPLPSSSDNGDDDDIENVVLRPTGSDSGPNAETATGGDNDGDSTSTSDNNGGSSAGTITANTIGTLALFFVVLVL